jgi:hypothetical protein
VNRETTTLPPHNNAVPARLDTADMVQLEDDEAAMAEAVAGR